MVKGWNLLLHSRCTYVAVALPVTVILSWIPALSVGATATVVASQSSKATCKQLTKAQIQPLLATPITKVKVTPALIHRAAVRVLGVRR